MGQYFLMHKNDICGAMIIDDDSSYIRSYKDSGKGKSPFLGNCDERKIIKWWEGRAVPASRKMVQDILKQNGYINTEKYLVKNLALSMTDAYWIRPISMKLVYEDISFSNLSPYNDGKVPYHNETSYDPNASLGGQMDKYWDLSTEKPSLVKESYKYFGQQAINEVFATMIHQRQQTKIPFVSYTAEKTDDNGVICRCEAFTSEDLEFVPAYEVIESSKNESESSPYDNYIRICANAGIKKVVMQEFMDYQTMTDFIISNTDEHLLNFGILRNPDTFEYIGPAPIFDSGNSMFFSEKAEVLSRESLLERQITGFYQTEEKMLKNVKNKDIVDLSLLPSEKECKELYKAYGIPKEKAGAIAKNYITKIKMAHDFQKGMKISLYHEKSKKS